MNKAYEVMIGDTKAFAVDVKTDCPHVEAHVKAEAVLPKVKGIVKMPCDECKDETENWVCLECGAVMCSRYINKHMAKHFQVSQHPIVLSFSDLSVWCFECEAYISHPTISKIHREIYFDKFGVYPDASKQNDDVDKITEELSKVTITDDRKKGIEKLAKRLKTAKHVVVLTGAGLSTAAGIPDFRSPGTGLYDNLQKYNLPHPTAIFEIDYFRKNPKAFYHLAKEAFIQDYKPTKCHYFIKLLEKHNMLGTNLTQNIDALEFKAGISRNKVVMAHGTYESATCQKCSMKYDIQHVKEVLHSSTTDILVPKCTACTDGVIKPDVVFFGEQLPRSFYLTMMNDIPFADLLIVIGTSLSVYPVASIVDMVQKGCTRVLINREKSGPFEDDDPSGYEDIFIGGDIEQAAVDICEALGWKEELEQEMKQ